MWDREYLHFKQGYNEYELLWLWFYYHTEKFDSRLPGQPDPWDSSSNKPFHYHIRESNNNAMSLRYHMKHIVGGDTGILDTFKKTFSKFKTKEIYELYDLLDKKGELEFIYIALKYLEDKNESIDYNIFQ